MAEFQALQIAAPLPLCAEPGACVACLHRLQAPPGLRVASVTGWESICMGLHHVLIPFRADGVVKVLTL